MDDLQRAHLIPIQRAAFECSAKCCDPRQRLEAIQQCADGCQRPIMAAQQVLYGELQVRGGGGGRGCGVVCVEGGG